MSVHVSSWAWKTDVGDAATKLVLLKLADHADDRGFCYPSIDLIVRDTCLSRSTVIRKLEKLEELGLLERERQREGNRNGVNRYRIRPKTESVTVTPSTETPEFHPGASQGVTVTPEPSGNHQSSRSKDRERAHDEIFQALVAATFPAGAVLTTAERRKVALAANNILTAEGTAEMVPAVVRAYQAANGFRECVVSAHALSNNWSKLAPTVRAGATCGECGLSAGRHLADCSMAAAA